MRGGQWSFYFMPLCFSSYLRGVWRYVFRLHQSLITSSHLQVSCHRLACYFLFLPVCFTVVMRVPVHLVSISIELAAFARALGCVSSWLLLKKFCVVNTTAFIASTSTRVRCKRGVPVDAKCAPYGSSMYCTYFIGSCACSHLT